MSKTEQTFTLNDGRKLGYAEYGDLSGIPLFFFHGWPNSRLHGEMLDETAKKLHIRVISPDRPGYGISEYQKNRTLLDFAKDIEQVADYLNLKKFAVLGNSGGGPYAVSCAHEIPKRITNVGIVVGLGPTYIDGALAGLPFFNRMGWSNYKRFPFLMYLAAFLIKTRANSSSLANLFEYASESDKNILKNLPLEELKRRRKEAFRHGIKGAAWDLKLYTNDWGFSLKNITIPVNLWYGEKDLKVSLAQGRYYANEIPNTTFTIYPDEGHMILYPHMEDILKAFV